MGNGIQITGLSSSFDLAASNFDADVARMMGLGNMVSRATANLPQSATAALFTFDGTIILTGIFGLVTTVIETQANNTQLVFDPTATGSNVALCANLNISADVVNSIYSITGTASDAMVDGLGVPMMVTPWVLQAGSVSLTCAASNTGQVAWWMFYQPITSGVTVAAA